MSYLPQHPIGPPPSNRKPPPANKPSLLLSREENQCIFDILGKGRQTLATAVVQLLVPTPDQRQWMKKDTGVVCFVRDQTKKSYFIQVLSLRTRAMVFRQEIYSQFEYHMPQEFFLTFEGDSSMVGINFADVTEASSFREALDNKLEAKRQRRNDTSTDSDDDQEERRSRHLEYQNQAQNHHQNNNQNHVVAAPVPLSNGNQQPSWGYRNLSKFNNKNKGRKDKDKKKGGLRKEDISNPTDFRHVQHVGWDPDKGYDLDGVDKDLQSFFEKVGVSANDLKDNETRRFIYKFIESHGGVELLRNNTTSMEISSTGQGPPPPPVPNISSNNNFPQAPPVPARSGPPNNVSKPSAPAPPSRPVPPPPPPHRTPNPHSPSQPNRTPQNPPIPPAPAFQTQSPLSNGPVPPPPPPLPPMFQPTYQPPSGSNNTSIGEDTDSGISDTGRITTVGASGDDRSALMKQIQGGIQLKKVSQEAQAKKPSGPKADLLKEIQEGVGLKPIPQDTRPPLSLDTVDGLAGALARALKDRAKAINPSDSESSDEDSNEFDEEEWG